MKKWGLLLVFLLCMGFAFDNKVPFLQERVEIKEYIGTTKNIEKKEITIDDIYQGNLLLVNREYPVHQKSIKSDVVNLFTREALANGYRLLGNEIYLSEEVSYRFSKLIDAAEKEGVNHFSINSGFRDFVEQSALYEEMGSDYALPAGYSEHNLGLSLDVGSTQMRMEDADEGKWIGKNAWKYGFILRYPKDKTDITGILYEPWHIRYVGLPHSAIMKEKNLVLEEYMDYLRERKSLIANVEGEQYTVFYYPVSENRKIDVPENKDYEISGNNIDGVIVTVFE
jgi:zinc D-Ala-D-Ala carboxypeptidase